MSQDARPTSSRTPRRSQRGQAVIEFAFFFMALMILLAGVVDIGTLLDDHMDVVYAARQGARTGAVLGRTDPQADCKIIAAIHSALLNQPNLTATRIVIYDSDASGNSTGAQDVYVEPANCSSPSTNTWPPSSRSDTVYFEDSLGVEIDYTYQFQFNWFGVGPFAGSDHAVFPISPSSASSST